MPPSKNISYEELSKYFHLPINQVAKELGVCATILKKICRKNGITRWPHRKIKSLDKLVADLEVNLIKNPQEREDTTKKIHCLKSKKMEILSNPDVLAKGAQKMDELLKPRAIKMTKTKNNLGHKVTKRQMNQNNGEINCFASLDQGPPNIAPLPALPSEFKPSYVQSILSASSPSTTTLAPVSKPQIINTLATLKFSAENPKLPNISESKEPTTTPATSKPSDKPFFSLSSFVLPLPSIGTTESIFNSPHANLSAHARLPSISDFMSRDLDTLFAPKPNNTPAGASLMDLVNARAALPNSYTNQPVLSQNKLPEIPLSMNDVSVQSTSASLLMLQLPTVSKNGQKLPSVFDEEKLSYIRNV